MEQFKYLIDNQKIWAEMYRKQKEEEHYTKRILFMREYNKTHYIYRRRGSILNKRRRKIKDADTKNINEKQLKDNSII
jgi:hypothetical protein